MVRAVRGATTVEKNDRQEILDSTAELLRLLVEQNTISEEDIISAIFSVTTDLDAVFPAVAARNMGWTDIALMCTNEMNVPGSLRKCIRVMLYFNTEKSNCELKYIYLHEAVKLRPDLFKNCLKMEEN
jgi:chorismate mutase